MVRPKQQELRPRKRKREVLGKTSRAKNPLPEVVMWAGGVSAPRSPAPEGAPGHLPRHLLARTLHWACGGDTCTCQLSPISSQEHTGAGHCSPAHTQGTMRGQGA